MIKIKTFEKPSSKNRKLIFMIFSLFCFIAAAVCLIVNMAIDRQLTWAAYPLISILFGWAVLSPLLIKKHGMILLLCSLTLLNLPYLYFMSKITPVTDWFLPLGLPSAIAGIITCWLLLLLFRYIKINVWYKAAFTTFWIGIVIASVINYFADIYIGNDPFQWNMLLNIFVSVIVVALLGTLGYTKSKTTNNQ